MSLIKIISVLSESQATGGVTYSMKRYLNDIINRSIDPSYGDTMQCFIGAVILKDGIYYCYYTGNSYNDGDIDTIFSASGADFNNLVKVNSGGDPTAIISPGAEPGGLTSTEVFGRHGYYDTEFSKFRLYYAIKPSTFPTEPTQLYLADSSDGVNFTKQDHVLKIAGENASVIAMWKNGGGDYVAVFTSQETGVAVFKHYYGVSTDGISWTGLTDITISGVKIVYNLTKIGNVYYIIGNTGFTDPHPPIGDALTLFSTTDFVTITEIGDLITKIEPTERGVGATSVIINESTIDIFHGFTMNHNKSPNNGGEPFSEVRHAQLNSNTFQIAEQSNIFPSYVKKYWPLYHSNEGATFTELVEGTTTTHSPNSWDSLKFLDLLSDTITFTNSGLPSASDLALKMRVVIDLSATKLDLFTIGTDIAVWLNAGLLHVSLNNGTKVYRSQNQIALPSGIGDPTGQDEVYLGFIFRNGTLTICNGNDTDYAKELIADSAMTDITDSQSNYIFGNSEIRSISLSTGMTDEQWINLDL